MLCKTIRPFIIMVNPNKQIDWQPPYMCSLSIWVYTCVCICTDIQLYKHKPLHPKRSFQSSNLVTWNEIHGGGTINKHTFIPVPLPPPQKINRLGRTWLANLERQEVESLISAKKKDNSNFTKTGTKTIIFTRVKMAYFLNKKASHLYFCIN